LISLSAATPGLLKHRGRGVVFKDIEDFKERIDDPALEIDENSVMVLRRRGRRVIRGCRKWEYAHAEEISGARNQQTW